ncbi:MAG: hypothetical protein U9N02_03795 [Campylobacterota bacterium]|nr:hypothetical protein [Campylobacterota bacterium]
MKKIITALLTALLFIGCSSKSETNEAIESKLVLKQSLESLKINDQHGKATPINADTKKVIFAFSKDVGHNCNEFFATKSESYLTDNKIQFVADVSGAPSLIRNMFIMPGLKDFKHTVLVIDDEQISANYKPAINNERIIVAYIENKIITNIKYLNSTEELEEEIAN